MLLNALSWIRSVIVTIPLIFVSTILLGATSMLAYAFGWRGRFQHRCMQAWASMLLAASFVHVSASGVEKLHPDRAYIFCSNHLSYMDPPIILACLRHRVLFVAKQSLFRIPVFGWAMRAAGNIAINRENPRAAARSLRQAADALRRGVSILIFPEGGRSMDGELRPFRSGAFRLAIELQAPIVPIAVAGSRQILTPGSINIRSGRVRVMAGSPIETRGMAARHRVALANEVRERIASLLKSQV
ncbi:MAG: 1-acyl-sn-glycerol-3-phosphate acyltransferase [Acidobacteria bacterium]|nr:1-acyl-sn-glycerol-3-phosphate acyltransferase [Acidobacteriota bacterium]